MRRTAAAAAVFVAVLCPAPHARADIGGWMPGPGLCDYPGVGSSGMEMGVYHYVCDFPTEINGSHWHCEHGGAAVQGTVGVSFPILSASISAPVGVLEGSCSWRCPDNTPAAAPNPPGAWKNHITPAKCQTIDAPPPVGPAPSGDLGPAVTNPDEPNPEATVNH